MQRKIAFCVGTWSAESTLFSWTFAKQYFLRKQRDEDGSETLSELDKLYIVHVSHNKAKEHWDSGGPILPRLSTALVKYPHTIVELEGRDIANAIVEFVKKEDIDILILGSREGKGPVQKMVPGSTVGSVSEAIKLRIKIPCLIIRPSSARNEKLRIKSVGNMEQLMADHGVGPGQSLPGSIKASMLVAQSPPEARKVCIAFEHMESGNNMVSWATKHCLFPDDDIHLVHMTNRSPLEKMQKSTSFQKAMLNKKAASPPAEDCRLEDVGVEDLQGYEEPHRARLKGDAKTELCAYLLDKGIDLLIVGYSAANRFKKAFTGGSLSSAMMQNAQCPVVVIPLKSMSWEDSDTVSNLPDLHSYQSGAIDSQASGAISEGDGASPPPLHSLGPRVSMSRSLSHQLTQARDVRRSLEGLISPSLTSPPSMSDRSRTSFPGASQDSARVLATGAQSSSQSRGAAGGDAAPLPPVPSPFLATELQPRISAESMDSQGHAKRDFAAAQSAGQGTGGAGAATTEAQLAECRRQLQEREQEVSQLKNEVRQLKFRLAAIQGSPTAGRTLLST